MSSAVELDQVTFRYPGGKAGIFDLSMQIQQGELVVCIGPSGCGKTTLLKLIAGFFRPDAGIVRLGGQDLTHASVASRGCGIVFQSYALFPHMRVWENIAYPLRVRGVPPEQRRRKAEEMLEMVGLTGTAERLPAQLSGGQQQRVALARALAFEPRALLLDEPLSALDAATRVVMRDEVRRIQKMHNIAALLITHDQDEALSLADRIAVLKDGRLVQYDTPAAIYDRPADGFVAGFVGRANVLAATASGPEQVDVPFGRLRTLPHGLRDGAAIKVLIRPERLEPAAAGESGTNLFEVRVLKDRFFGATRQLDMTIGEAVLKLETTSRAALTRVRVPVEAIQFLPNP
jgi:putative spermidine/putrescine transport system ATP-binding protein